MSEHKEPIPSMIYNASVGGHVTNSQQIIDENENKEQSKINSDLIAAIGTVDLRISAAVSVEQSRAQSAESSLSTGKADKATTLAGYGITDAYTKSETYTKTEVNGLVDTPHQEYVTVATYSALPAKGSKDTIYRVSNYNGSTSQVDTTSYSEYAWNGSQYVFLCVKSQIGEVFDISAYNNNAKYADLAAALNGGANIPQSLQKGGMSVKFKLSHNNKYICYNLLADSFTTDTTQWAIDSVGTYVENPEFLMVYTDKNKRILWAIKNDGDIYYGIGVPSQIYNFVRDYVDSNNMQKAFVSTSFTAKLNEIKSKNADIPEFVHSTESPYIINIDSQSEFNTLQNSISTAIQNGEKNIIVSISEGIYYAYNVIELNGISDEDISISFVGIGNVTIISGGNSYSLSNVGATIEGGYIKVPYKETFSLDFKYSNDKGYINTYEQSKFSFCKQLIQVIDETVDLKNHYGQCYIENTNITDKPASECTDLYIQITIWYQSFYYKVLKIENGAIYFECNNLNVGRDGVGYNVNNDYSFAHKMPRYRLVNYRCDGIAVEDGYIYVPSEFNNVYESKVESFLIVNNSRIGNLLIKGITFRNFTGDTINISNSSHINGILITHNNFIGCGACVLYRAVEDNNNDNYNFHFTHNLCKYIYNYCYKDEGNVEKRITKNVEIANNIVEDSNLRLNNNSAFASAAKNFYIAHNTIKNERSGYNISGGRWYDSPLVYGVRLQSSGIIEYNEIYFDSIFYNEYDQYTLMDTGAIYTFTNNDDIVIRYNYIHEVISMGTCFGIYLDDGAKNVSVFNNIIINSTETESISSRSVPLDGRDDENTNVSILYNIIDAPCKLEGNPNVKPITCVKGRNFITTKENGVYNSCEKEDDYIILFSEINCNGIFFKREVYNAAKSVCDPFIISKIHLKG